MLGSLAFLVLTAAQPSGPVYLECVTDQYGEPYHWNITLNEQQGTAEFNTKVGRRRTNAQFTADKVLFAGFTLSRVDLTMQRPVASLDLTGTVLEKGSCQIAKPVDRAF